MTLSEETDLSDLQKRPLLRSRTWRSWSEIGIERYRRPAGEGETATGYHRFCLRLTPEKRVVINLDGARVWEGPARRNSVSFVPATVTHAWASINNADVIVVFQDILVYDKIIKEIASRDVLLAPSIVSNDRFLSGIIQSIYRNIEDSCVANTIFSQSLSVTLATAVIHRAFHHSGMQMPQVMELPAERLSRVSEYVESNLGSQLPLEEIAQLADMSSFHFLRSFKDATGSTPHQFILQRRVDRAKQLLVKTTQSMMEISCALGFASVSHFSSTFRQKTGVTPTVFRRQAR
jgi:AraC family transcriptional regulator